MKISVKVKADVNAVRILASRGLGPPKETEKFLASEVLRLSDPYTPMQGGTLKSGQIATEGKTTITYNAPYAHYQWHGMVMGGSAPKHYTGAALTYHGGPMRGKEWTKRMMADRKGDLVRSVAKKVGGKPK